MKRLLLLGFLVLFSLNILAITSKDVSYKSGDETVRGILYTPSGTGLFPAIIAVHEWWGLNDWVKEQASKLSDQGYVVLAVDLYRGRVAQNPDTAHQLMRGVPPDRANRDLEAAVAFLKSQKNVNPDRIGSIGWCMGGGYALDVALLDPSLAATVINYGHLATDPEQLKKIHAPILGLFGGLDQGITPDDVKKFEQQVKSLGKSVEVKIYPDAGHGFENPNNKDGYRAADTADAWQRTLTFLAARLKT